jgi:hypothetical protein
MRRDRDVLAAAALGGLLLGSETSRAALKIPVLVTPLKGSQCLTLLHLEQRANLESVIRSQMMPQPALAGALSG